MEVALVIQRSGQFRPHKVVIVMEGAPILRFLKDYFLLTILTRWQHSGFVLVLKPGIPSLIPITLRCFCVDLLSKQFWLTYPFKLLMDKIYWLIHSFVVRR